MKKKMTYKDINLFISDDNMKAYIEVNNVNFSINDILMLLMKEKIVYGILDSNIKNMLNEKEINKKYLIALGKEPEDEIWDKFEYYIDDNKENMVKHDINDRIDYKNLNLIENVVVEQVLIQRLLTKKGKLGKDIFGKNIPYKVIKKEFPAGENTKIADYDDNLLVAAINGHIYKCDDKICVSDKYYIDGNIDYTTGNIVYLGDLYISGDIREGFSVQAAGSIFLQGNCEKANVICGKDFIVNKGIIGSINTKVKVEGDCKADYIENCRLECKGTINVKKYINHSHVICGDRIIMQEDSNIPTNMIIGGEIIVKNSIECDNIGNRFNTLTYIELGSDPFLKKQIESLKKLIGLYEDKYFNQANQLDFLGKFFSAPTEEQSNDPSVDVDKLLERKKELEKTVPILYNKIRDEQKKMKLLQAKFEKEMKHVNDDVYIKVRSSIYHGVKILIKGKSLDIVEELTRCIIKIENDQIKIEKME